MLIRSRTPLRISFFGGGTDYPSYYHRFQGAVIGTTISHYTHVTVKKAPYYIHSSHPIIEACRKKRGVTEPFEATIRSDLPIQSGLGSSSSCVVGVLHALSLFQHKESREQELALEAIEVEQILLQEVVGSQDQVHAAIGGFNWISFQRDHISYEPIVLSESFREELELSLTLFYIGERSSSTSIATEQVQRTESAHNLSYLHDLFDITMQAKAILTSPHCSLNEFGRLLHEGWERKKKLSTKITNSSIDALYEKGRSLGAFGGKICGAGGGGFLLLAHPPEIRNRLKEEFRCFSIDVVFEKRGSIAQQEGVLCSVSS